jgi:hypothetical protein
VSNRRAKIGGEFTGKVDILRRLMEQDYTCPITHRRFDPGEVGPWQPSVDRLDSDGGYTAGNMRIVAYIANLAMSTWGEKALRELAVAPGLRPDGDVGTKGEIVCHTENIISRKPLRLLPPIADGTEPAMTGV